MAFSLSFRVMNTCHMCTRQTRQERPTQHSMSYNQLTIATAIVCFEWTFSRSAPAYAGCNRLSSSHALHKKEPAFSVVPGPKGTRHLQELDFLLVASFFGIEKAGSHKCKEIAQERAKTAHTSAFSTIYLRSYKLRAHILVEPEVVDGWRPLLN